MNKLGINLGHIGICPVGAPLAPGQIGLANEGAFANTFLSEPLTDYAAGWKTDDLALETLLDFLAPPVRVSQRFEYRSANNGDNFAMVANDGDVRALYGEFQLVKSVGSVISSRTVSKGLTTVIERNGEMPGEREQKIGWLKKMCIRAEIYRAIALLDAAATSASKTWGSSATPDADLLTAVESFGDAVGIDANRILFGSTAWQKRIASYQAQASKAFQPAATMAALADFLGVSEIRKSNERYTTGSGKSKLVTAANVYVFYGDKNVSTEDASTLKRFWTPEDGGGEWAVYVDEITNPKVVRLTVAHTSQIATTISTGVQRLVIS